MRVFAPVALLLTGLIAVAWFLSTPRQTYVPAVSPRDLLSDRDYWHGRVVRVSVADMTAGDHDTLIYRIFADREPLLVISWAGAAPANRPTSVVGTFRAGTPGRLTGCHPVP